MHYLIPNSGTLRSLSARRAWIEIGNLCNDAESNPVALRKESVDRNASRWATASARSVALRKESVDRNWALTTPSTSSHVALRKESVDRNRLNLFRWRCFWLSLSARRAWIEICLNILKQLINKRSLSARRAWIEITPEEVETYEEQSRSPQGERG